MRPRWPRFASFGLVSAKMPAMATWASSSVIGPGGLASVSHCLDSVHVVDFVRQGMELAPQVISLLYPGVSAGLDLL